MALTEEQIRHVAKLGRLRLSEEDVEMYRTQVHSILTYVEKLQEVDMTDVPELQHAQAVVNVFREDVVEGCDEDTRTRALENFSNKEGDLLSVQAVFEGRTE